MIATTIEPIAAPTMTIIAIVGYPVFLGDIISSVAVMIFGNENKENSRRVYI